MSTATKPSPALLAKSKGAVTKAALVDADHRKKVIEVQLTTEELIDEINHYSQVQLENRTKCWSGDRWATASQYLEVLVCGNPNPDFRVEIEELDRDEARKVFAYTMYKFSKLTQPHELLQIPGTRKHKSDWYLKLKSEIESNNRNMPFITVEELNIDPS